MNSEDKLDYVEKQVGAVMRGETNVINCPYCGETNQEGNPHACCVIFGKAILAIFHRQDVADDIREYERIAEAVDKQTSLTVN